MKINKILKSKILKPYDKKERIQCIPVQALCGKKQGQARRLLHQATTIVISLCNPHFYNSTCPQNPQKKMEIPLL
jgi:hypothetical protein